MGAIHDQPTALALVGTGGATVGSGVPSSVGLGTRVVGGGSVVGSGLPSDGTDGGVVTGGLVVLGGGVGDGGMGGFVVGGGATGVGAVPVCVQRYCFDVPSCVQVRTIPPVFGRVPGTVGGAGTEMVGSGGIVGRGAGLAAAS
ncbi:hypothetical protein [Pseudonocardia alni]|uniref:Uncharacterized protein n=1 Tax=Pseudonocardia alni TaxID=33907 RepID=A0A852W329_PSEA5|nr:hypothetical protein [Pseudonocardia antarctica]NYG00356.1 hypothetical protein [Pseudonocardia antarctica]